MDEYNIIDNLGGSYLDNGDRYFTMTPSTSSIVWVVDYNGEKRYNLASYAPYGIRPVITVSSEVNFSQGDGTATNPYRFEIDDTLKENDELTKSNSGDYVKFANKRWRVVHTGSYTKLVLDSPLSIGSVVKLEYGSSNKFNLEDGVGKYLNETFYGTFTEDQQAMMEQIYFYANDYLLGDNPTETSLKGNSTNRIQAYVGLNSVGQLMSGSSYTGRVKDFTTWLINYNSNTGNAWMQSSIGANDISELTDIRGIRPVIGIKGDITITSGNGTYENPYVIN